RTVLHDQGSRRRDRARAVRRTRDRVRSRRLDRRPERSGKGDGCLDLPRRRRAGDGGGRLVTGRVLVVDDDASMCDMLVSDLGEVQRLRRAVEEARRFGALLGTSPAMRRLYDLLDRIVDSNASVLVTGETGTGKELVARALHDRGRRKAGPFVVVNCAALPEPLLESELFGHVRGAFTDAHATRKGLLLQASGGTLFLD